MKSYLCLILAAFVCLSACGGHGEHGERGESGYGHGRVVIGDVDDIIVFEPGPGQCEGRLGELPILPAQVAAYKGNLFVVSSLEHVLYRIDSYHRCFLHNNYSSFVAAQSFSIGLQVDRKNGDFYIANGGGENAAAGCETGCVIRVRGYKSRIFGSLNVNNAPNVYSGIAINYPRGLLHISGAVPGVIVTMDMRDGYQVSVFQDASTTVSTFQFWDSPPGSGVVNPDATNANINLFGAPLGAEAIAIHPDGHTLWTCNLDLNTLSEHRLDYRGRVIGSRVVLDFTPFSCKGLAFEDDTLFAGAPFEQGDDLTELQSGDSVFVIDVRDYSYIRMPGVTGVLTGTALGKDYHPFYNDAIISAASGFDGFPGWPCGNVANGADFPCQVGPGPFPNPTFAIRATRMRRAPPKGHPIPIHY